MNSILFIISIYATILSLAFYPSSISTGLSIVSQGIVVILFLEAVYKTIVSKGELPNILILWIGCIILPIIIFPCIPVFSYEMWFGDIRELFIPFAICLASYKLFNFKIFDHPLQLTSLSVITIFGILFSLINSGGLEIQMLYRPDLPKNQTSPLFTIIGLVFLYFVIYKRFSPLTIINIFTCVSCLAYVVIIRARTASIAFVLIAFILLIFRYKRKFLFILPIFILIIGIMYGNQISLIFEESFVGNTDIEDLDSLTSGRTGRIEDAIAFISEHLFLGSLYNSYLYPDIWEGNFLIPHMYILWKLIKYGILLSLPYLIMYFAIPIQMLKLINDSISKYAITIGCIGVAYIISLGEYSAPFGPGTSFIIPYIFLGYSLRQLQLSKENKNKNTYNEPTLSNI